MNFIKNKKEKGFTMLFAVLVSVIVLAVGASIISIALKQVVLSGIGRESQYAFYSANTGVECALYWDLNFDVFAETDAGQTGVNRETANCADMRLVDGALGATPEYGPNNETLVINRFSLDMDQGSRCVDVDVIKNVITVNNVDVVSSTTIMSRGYNNCDENSPRRVERGLQITY